MPCADYVSCLFTHKRVTWIVFLSLVSFFLFPYTWCKKWQFIHIYILVKYVFQVCSSSCRMLIDCATKYATFWICKHLVQINFHLPISNELYWNWKILKPIFLHKYLKILIHALEGQTFTWQFLYECMLFTFFNYYIFIAFVTLYKLLIFIGGFGNTLCPVEKNKMLKWNFVRRNSGSKTKQFNLI